MYVAGGRGGPGGRGGGRGGFGRGFGDDDGRIQTCYKCGGPNHFARDCHAKSVKCYACGKFEGHIVPYPLYLTFLTLLYSLENVLMPIKMLKRILQEHPLCLKVKSSNNPLWLWRVRLGLLYYFISHAFTCFAIWISQNLGFRKFVVLFCLSFYLMKTFFDNSF